MGNNISCTGTCKSADADEIAGCEDVQPISSSKVVDGTTDDKILQGSSSKRRSSSRQSKVYPEALPSGPATAWTSAEDGNATNLRVVSSRTGGQAPAETKASSGSSPDASASSAPKLASADSNDVSSSSQSQSSNNPSNAVKPLLDSACVADPQPGVVQQDAPDTVGVAQAADEGIVSSVLATCELMAACKDGDVAVVRKLLTRGSGVNVNDRDEEGRTPLHLASTGGHLEVVQALLTAPDIDVNARDKEDASAMCMAAGYGHVDVLRALLATRGVDVNARYGSIEMTVLHIAANGDNVDVVQTLLAAPGVDVNAQTTDGFSPLFTACFSGRLEVARAILAAPGVDVNLAMKNGYTPLQVASEKGFLEMVQTLLAVPGVEIKAPNERGWTALHCAGHHGRVEVVKALLAAADVGYINIQGHEDGWTAIHATIQTGQDEALVALLTAPDIDFSLRDTDGYTALELASKDWPRMVAHFPLAKPGVPAGTAGKDGRTPLHHASANKHSAAMEALIKAPGVDVNARDEDEKTALHLVCEGGFLEGVRLLLVVPSLDINARNEDGLTGLHIASRKDMLDIVTVLLSALSLDVNVQDKDGRSALHYASWRGNLKIVRALLAAPGVDATLRDVDGFTAAHLAAMYGRSEVTQQLVRAASTSLQSISLAASALEFMQEELATRAKDIAWKAMETQVPTSFSVNDLPECVADLHYGMPEELQRKPSRLIKVSKLLSWDALLVYEDVPKLDTLTIPYADIGESFWDRTVSLSWRWNKPKPAVRQPGFSPMSARQFSELKSMLRSCQESSGVEYVWIDWCSVPQYCADTRETMVEVLRSKAYYVRARQMHILPTFEKLSKSGQQAVAVVLEAMKGISDKADCKPGDPLILEVLSDLTKDGAMVATHDYFRRIWTLAERMTRYGHDERLCHYLSLSTWLGMVIEALLSNSEDSSTLDIFDFDPDNLNTVRGALQSYTSEGVSSSQITAIADVFISILRHAVYAWWGHKTALEDTPTTDWLLQYLANACSEVYQATCAPDRVWAIYSYYSKNTGEGAAVQPSSFLGALKELFRIATGSESRRLPSEKPESLPYPPDEEVRALLGQVTLEIRQNRGDEQNGILLDAAKQGLVEVVKILLDEGANVNYASEEGGDDTDTDSDAIIGTHSKGDTVLHIASRWGQQEVVKLLLQTPGVNVNAKNEDGFTALICASHAGHVKVVRALLDTPGVDIDESSLRERLGALHIACMMGHVEVVRALLAAPGVDIHTNLEGTMAIHVACRMGHASVVHAILEAAKDMDINVRDLDSEKRLDQTPLHHACKGGSLEVVQLLLSTNGVDVNAKRLDGATPLQCAVKKGNLEVVQAFLARPDVGVSVQDILIKLPDVLKRAKRDITSIIELLQGYKH